MKRRLLAGVLTFVMVLSLLPTSVWALGEEQAGGLTATAADTLPEEGQTTNIKLSGGEQGEQIVRISGYNAPWYVTEGLVLQYDGIYNTGKVGEHEENAGTWTPLVSTVGDMKITIPTNLNEGEGWTVDNGLYLKNTTIGNTGFSSALTASQGFTWDYMFALNSSDYDNWDMSTNPIYRTPMQLVSDYSGLGGINNSTRVLFYDGTNNWPPYLTPFQGNVPSTLTLTTGAADANAHRKVYQNGVLDSHNGVDGKGYPNGNATEQSEVEDHTFVFSGIAFPTMAVSNEQAVDKRAYNLGRTIYGARLYNRELSADEIAQNAEVDALRYRTNNYSIGTADSHQLLEQFDGNTAYTEIQVTFDENSEATIPLVLNYAGENDLTFTVNGKSADLTLNVLTAEDKASVNAVNKAIDDIPAISADSSEDELKTALEKVAAAQKAYGELDEDLRGLISTELMTKLDNAASEIDKAAAGKHTVTVSYDVNGGTSNLKPTEVIYKETEKVDGVDVHKKYKLAVPTRKNYTFEGWMLNGDLITDANGDSYDWWDSLSNAEVVAQWTSNAEANAALEITEADDIYALARIFGGTGTVADYQRFGYDAASTTARNKLMDAAKVYELKNDITLTNHNGEAFNGFYGIPNFAGTFNGNGHTITLDINFSVYTNTGECGGVFQSLNGATVKNIELAGTASGNISLSTTLNNIGLLIGVANGSKATTIENIRTNVAVDNTTLTNNNHTAYIGELIGRSAMGSAAKLAVTKCINDGNITVAVVGEQSNPSRVAGLVGHANAGIVMDSCRNNGTVTVTGDTTYAGGLAGTSGGTYVNCVEAGSLSAEKGSAALFSGMPKTVTKADGNKIIVKIIGTDGEKITAQDGVNATVTDGNVTLELPVYYVSDTSRRYDKYDIAEAIVVNGEKSLYLYDMRTRTATLTLNTEDATAEAVPFSSWNTAIHLASAEDMINLQNAINNGDANAIAAVYKLGGIAAAPTDLATVQMVLRSAYYVLDNDVTLNQGFTGIGTATNGFGGHFDGGNHKVTLSITATPSETEETGYYGLFGKMGPLTDGAVEVKNLKVESTIAITLPNSLAYGVYAGGLAGYAQRLTVDNVTVTTNGISAQAATAMTNQNGQVVSLGGAFGFERILIGGTVDTTVSGPIIAKISGAKNSAQLGGFAGQGETGGSVTFTDGASVLADTGAASDVGGIMGYSWAQNDFTGLTVENLSETPLQLGGTNARTGLVIGHHTTTGIQPNEVGVKIDGFQPEGKFAMSGKTLGGLIGLLETNGIVEITNSAANVGAGTGTTHLGGLVGECWTSTKTTYQISNTLYVKATDSLQAVGYPSSDVEGAVALDVTKVTNGTFSTPIADVLSAAASTALTVSGNAKLDGTSLIYTEAGDNQEIKFLWNGQELYSTTVKVAQKDLTNDDNVTITGVNSTYPSDEAAAKAEIDVIYNGVKLVEGTDYTVSQDKTAREFTITFDGNYTGSAKKNYNVEDGALVVTAKDYTGTYDGEFHGITFTPVGVAVKYKASAGAESYTEESCKAKDAGTYVVYWQAEKDGQTVTGSAVIVINKAPLTIKADNQFMYVGGTVPTPTYTATGLVKGETLTKVDLACTADGKTTGKFDIVPANAVTSNSNNNYEITYVNGTLTVSRRHSSSSSTVTPTPEPTPDDRTGFADVPANAYFADAVKWAVDKGITNGLSDTMFGPYESCTRAQIVTFLWRAAGSPEPKTASSFTDVPANAYYAKAVAWAVENGITNGMTATEFAPDATCTRGQSVTFLYRALKGTASGSTNFTDVKSDAFYADAINWAVANNVTNGTSNTTFSPNADCTRAEIVTFLYRAYQGK